MKEKIIRWVIELLTKENLVTALIIYIALLLTVPVLQMRGCSVPFFGSGEDSREVTKDSLKEEVNAREISVAKRSVEEESIGKELTKNQKKVKERNEEIINNPLDTAGINSHKRFLRELGRTDPLAP